MDKQNAPDPTDDSKKTIQDIPTVDMSDDDQLLVAYLDRELDAEKTAVIEDRLTQESALRDRLHTLQQTWDMLDELPSRPANESFVESTIEMMVTSTQSKLRKWHRWPLRLTALAAAFVITAAVVFQVVRGIQNRPYRQFVKDLDFISNIDFYDEVDNIEFLEQLKNEALFAEDLPRGP